MPTANRTPAIFAVCEVYFSQKRVETVEQRMLQRLPERAVTLGGRGSARGNECRVSRSLISPVKNAVLVTEECSARVTMSLWCQKAEGRQPLQVWLAKR